VKEVVWLVGVLAVVYAVARFLVFLKKKTEKGGEKGEMKARREGGEKNSGGEVRAAVFAGIAAYEEGLRGGGIRKKRIVGGGKQGEASLWKTSGRMGRKNREGGR